MKKLECLNYLSEREFDLVSLYLKVCGISKNHTKSGDIFIKAALFDVLCMLGSEIDLVRMEIDYLTHCDDDHEGFSDFYHQNSL